MSMPDHEEKNVQLLARVEALDHQNTEDRAELVALLPEAFVVLSKQERDLANALHLSLDCVKRMVNGPIVPRASTAALVLSYLRKQLKNQIRDMDGSRAPGI